MICHTTNQSVLPFCHMYFQICFNVFIQCYLNIAYKLSIDLSWEYTLYL